MEPIAARLDPEHAQARYASIQRLITDSEWDYQALLGAVRDYCLPLLIAKPQNRPWTPAACRSQSPSLAKTHPQEPSVIIRARSPPAAMVVL